MKKIAGLKLLVLVITVMFAVTGLLTACGEKAASSTAAKQEATKQDTDTKKAEETKKADDNSGSITAVGSTALQPLAEKAAQQFMSKNPNAKVQVQGGGSGTGLTQVFSGGADIGNSDIFADEKLKDDAKALVDHKVCVVGFAAVVSPKVKVDTLTKAQMIDIFTGKITNWKDVGGDDMKVVIINRPKSSGTRATFKKYALDGKDEAEGKALTEDSSGTVRKTVAETDGSIAYLALSYVDTSVKALKFEGTEATVENITSGKYPIWSYEHMYTKGEAKGIAKAFLDYMTGDEVQKKLIPELKFIPVSDMKVTR